jgi:hypothetical protein
VDGDESSSSSTEGRSQGLGTLEYGKVLGAVIATVGVSAAVGALIIKKWG